MFTGMMIIGAVKLVLAEEESFQKMISAMPECERAAAIQRRMDQRKEELRQQEHDDLVDASKPHTLWSFLGLGSK